MSGIKSIRQQTNNRFLNCFELEAIHRDGGVSPYYVASRAKNISALKAVTHENNPDGEFSMGFTGNREIGWCSSASTATPWATIYMNSPRGLWRTERK